MSTWPDRKEVLRWLKDLQEGGAKDLALGICDNISLTTDECTEFLVPLFVRWPEYSGDQTFPVPPHNAGPTASQAYMSAEDLWDRRTKYGRARFGGCFSTREHATRFGSFEEAQPTVQRLRREAPHFYFNAINIL